MDSEPSRSGLPIQLVNATKRYGGKPALDDVTLEFEPGEMVAIVGLNGAGKSTLLKAISGVIALNQGHVFINGTPLRREDLDQRRQVMFIPDIPFLIPQISVMDNLATYLEHYHCETTEHTDRASELLVEFEIAAKAQSFSDSLSRGQLYKVGMTALLTINPNYWLLDEPFASGMDAQGISTFKREARAATESGASVVYTTQLVDLARDFSDRICILNHGKVIAFEPYDTLKKMSEAPEHSALKKLF